MSRHWPAATIRVRSESGPTKVRVRSEFSFRVATVAVPRQPFVHHSERRHPSPQSRAGAGRGSPGLRGRRCPLAPTRDRTAPTGALLGTAGAGPARNRPSPGAFKLVRVRGGRDSDSDGAPRRGPAPACTANGPPSWPHPGPGDSDSSCGVSGRCVGAGSEVGLVRVWLSRWPSLALSESGLVRVWRFPSLALAWSGLVRVLPGPRLALSESGLAPALTCPSLASGLSESGLGLGRVWPCTSLGLALSEFGLIRVAPRPSTDS